MNYSYYRILLLPVILSYLVSCLSPSHNISPSSEYQNSSYQDTDQKYDSYFPQKPVAKELERILESVKMVSNLTFYESFEYSFESKTLISDVRSGLFREKATNRILFEQPASGTATVIYHQGRKIALLTCEHVVSSPDTIISYYEDNLGLKSPVIRTIAIKSKEINNIIFLPGQQKVQVIAKDRQDDLALISVLLDENPKFGVTVFDYKIGKASELDWGTFVYIIGYPYGKKLISSALVSSPNRNRKHSFIVDATMHKGISGGLILALRDGPPNFELVGLANAISGEQEFVLRPDPAIDQRNFKFSYPYEGEIYLDTQVKINYGITFAVSIETIQNFLKRNKNEIESEGLSLNQFFN